jgi:hypothetical protein
MRTVTTTAAPPTLKAWWERFAFTRRAKKDAEEKKGVHPLYPPWMFPYLSAGPHPPYPSPPNQNVIFGKPLEESLKYAREEISTPNAKGELYIWGYIPRVVAKLCVPFTSTSDIISANTKQIT